jgi:hypothetical protein
MTLVGSVGVPIILPVCAGERTQFPRTAGACSLARGKNRAARDVAAPQLVDGCIGLSERAGRYSTMNFSFRCHGKSLHQVLAGTYSRSLHADFACRQ